jgi:triosephosphate isomerase
MYKTIEEALAFIEKIKPLAEQTPAKVMLAVPYTAIAAAVEKAAGSHIVIGAQNMNDASDGAFTGEVAAVMLAEAGASFVLLGHSERRKIFGETNAFINRKVKRALTSNIKFILCIGETADEREKNLTQEVLRRQLTECFDGVKIEKGGCMVAYEPVWAIGTGIAATPEIAEGAHHFCRTVLSELFGEEVAQTLPILYGGSVNAANATNFVAEKDIDGLLIGSASLAPESFAKIIVACQNRA